PRPGQPGHLLRGAARAGGMHLDRAVGVGVAGPGPVSRRALLRGGRPPDRVRLQDRRQRAAARQAEGWAAPRGAECSGVAGIGGAPAGAGSRTANSAPPPGGLETSTIPPIAAASSSTIPSPTPAPTSRSL